MIGQNSGVSSPQQNKEKQPTAIGYMYAKSFRGAYQQCANLSPLYFYIWGHLKPLVYSVLIEKEEHFANAFLMLVEPIATAPGPLKGCDSPRLDRCMSMRAMILLEDVLSICCEV